jgi:hypothetical protein
MTDVDKVLDLAYLNLEDPAKVDQWLHTSNPALEGDSPLDLIAKGAVLRLLSILAH